MALALHMRSRDGEEQRTRSVVLFFDLVYVFAITQLSHFLIDNLNAEGALKTAFLLMVVWWAWIYTTWMANWFEPSSTRVRLVLLGGMLASLLMAAALPHAFEEQGPLFACSYVLLQVGRNVAGLALLRRDAPLRRTFERFVFWSAGSGILWLAGGFASEEARPWLWGAALAVDFAGPLTRYATPWLGRAATTEWTVEGGHFAERFQLFIIIALGESIVLTGSTADDAGLTASTVIALALAFVLTGLLWLYFDEVAENSQRVIAEHDDPGRLARDAFSYLHIPIVAGIILAAVGAELLILHPRDPLEAAGIAVVIGGPLLYLIGEALFRWRMAAKFSAKRLGAVAAIALLAIPAPGISALALAGAVVAVLAILAAWEYPALGKPA